MGAIMARHPFRLLHLSLPCCHPPLSALLPSESAEASIQSVLQLPVLSYQFQAPQNLHPDFSLSM